MTSINHLHIYIFPPSAPKMSCKLSVKLSIFCTSLLCVTLFYHFLYFTGHRCILFAIPAQIPGLTKQTYFLLEDAVTKMSIDS